jgi:uncharacterized membrane protein
MPYRWTVPDQTLQLWPHQSLPPHGFVAFIGISFCLSLIPLLAVLGTALLWGLLPFVIAVFSALYFALRHNHRSRRLTEVLTLDDTWIHLTHRPASGPAKEWRCNRYWIQVFKYDTGGPVPHYVTLRGDGREVEIGAFLSEEERIALYDELRIALRRNG